MWAYSPQLNQELSDEDSWYGDLKCTNLHRTENWYEFKSSPIGVTCDCQSFY